MHTTLYTFLFKPKLCLSSLHSLIFLSIFFSLRWTTLKIFVSYQRQLPKMQLLRNSRLSLTPLLLSRTTSHLSPLLNRRLLPYLLYVFLFPSFCFNTTLSHPPLSLLPPLLLTIYPSPSSHLSSFFFV